MCKILVLYGSSGVGKSTIMEYINHSSVLKFSLLTKYTTRKPRINDSDHKMIGGLDLLSFSSFVNFSYSCYDQLYGLNLAEIDSMISDGVNVVVDIGDIKAIIKLKSIYLEKLNTIWVERNCSKEETTEILKKRSTNEEEIEKRLLQRNEYNENYIQHRSLFDYTLLNNGSLKQLELQVNSIIKRISKRIVVL